MRCMDSSKSVLWSVVEVVSVITRDDLAICYNCWIFYCSLISNLGLKRFCLLPNNSHRWCSNYLLNTSLLLLFFLSFGSLQLFVLALENLDPLNWKTLLDPKSWTNWNLQVWVSLPVNKTTVALPPLPQLPHHPGI